jgi:ubiquinone/menaquinone biosynthesis C-methylase UbiE
MEIRDGASEYYEQAELYDQLYPGLPGDVEFYLALAQAATPPVLELACGTGRVTLPIARAGVPILGLDAARPMLEIAERKAEGLKGIRWIQGDMRDYALDERFGLIFIPYRSFLHLLTTEEQLQALATAYRHLLPGGRLALNIFNPSIATIAAWMGELSGAQRHLLDYRDPASQRRHTVWQSRRYRQSEQRLDELRVYEELDRGSQVLSKTYRSFKLRYIFRYEMEHLLHLAGFEIEALYGSFDRRPFDERSTEMIWVARRPEVLEADLLR